MVRPFQRALKFYPTEVNDGGAPEQQFKRPVFKRGSRFSFCARVSSRAFFKHHYYEHFSIAFEPTTNEAKIENDSVRPLETSLLTTTWWRDSGSALADRSDRS